MNKVNTTSSFDDQMTFDYALYMIASSYFAKAECKNPILAKRRYIHYKEQKADKQYKMEDICIELFDDLEKKLPEEFFAQSVEIHMLAKEGMPMEILIVGKEHSMVVGAKYEGKKTKIKYHFVQVQKRA